MNFGSPEGAFPSSYGASYSLHQVCILLSSFCRSWIEVIFSFMLYLWFGFWQLGCCWESSYVWSGSWSMGSIWQVSPRTSLRFQLHLSIVMQLDGFYVTDCLSIRLRLYSFFTGARPIRFDLVGCFQSSWMKSSISFANLLSD